MNKLLIVVDMQNDFIDGALGTPEAQAIVPKVVEKIKSWEGHMLFTRDSHDANYLNTNEGRHLPIPHCIVENHHGDGFALNDTVHQAGVDAVIHGRCAEGFSVINKSTFGSIELAKTVKEGAYDYVELVGLCTDICVVTNALLIKTYCPEATVVVDASCCAGVTPESHKAALLTMKMCQVDVIGEDEAND